MVLLFEPLRFHGSKVIVPGVLRSAVIAVLLLVVLTVAPSAALADFAGRVVTVADGDTLTVLVNKTQIRVRLDGIDAPERGQAFGKRSRQSLGQICAAKAAEAVERGKDRYGRTIGRVMCAGIEANSEQIRRGMAWVFVRYAPPGSSLYALEGDARSAKRGLWVEALAVAPWEWRGAKRAPQSSMLK